VPLKFTGHERDSFATSSSVDVVDDMKDRFTSPLSGRFLSADKVPPMRAARSKPQLWNLYAYVGGNPIRFVDPTGEKLQLPSQGWEEELQALKDMLIASGAADVAEALTVENVGGAIQVVGLPKELERSHNMTVRGVARLVNDQRRVARLSLTSQDLSARKGAWTGYERGVLETRINPKQATSEPFRMSPALGPMAGKLFLLMGLTLDEALAHEIGHAMAFFSGDPGGEVNQRKALEYENFQRSMKRPQGRGYYERLDHQ